MKFKQLATKINSDVKDAVDAICEQLGVKMNRFVEDALLDKIEEIEDLHDVAQLRAEPSKALDDVIKGLKKNGKL